MREVIGYHAEALPDGAVRLSRALKGNLEQTVTDSWLEAVTWLTRRPADDPLYFTVCHSLHDFARALFVLLPDEAQDEITDRQRTVHDGIKVFQVKGRYLGLTMNVPSGVGANVYVRRELNLTALRWWISEEEPEPVDAAGTAAIGTRIVQALDRMNFSPTKLTSPVAAFVDHLGDARDYPTLFNFPDEHFEAMQYAEEMMRYEWRSAYQVGAFDKTHLYDLTSAYPSVIERLPSTINCRCEHATARPDWSTWGIMYGEITVNTDVSPLVFDMGDGLRINPRGRWKGFFTTREVDWLERWHAGTFTLEDGYFFRFGKERPYQKAMHQLYYLRNNAPDGFTATITKKMAQGVSGKLDEDRDDGRKGDFYNPLLAAMVRSETRIAVADFIHQHQLQDHLIAVLVDSVLTTQEVELPHTTGMGTWRYEGALPALVLSKGAIWRPGKRPQGITYEQIIRAIVDNPESAYYEFTTASGSQRSIDLLLDATDTDRNFDEYPECGRDVLSTVYHSTALETGEGS